MTTKPDQFHYHEVVDRLFMINAVVDAFLMHHPAVEVIPELKAKVVAASEALGEAYQIAGRYDA